jgi:hypothetical protein
MRLPLLALLALAGSALLGTPPARGDDRLPGEVTELTPEVRATAQGHVDAIVKGTGDALKARRALLVLGPAVCPVVDNALRLAPPEAARPHLAFLKALLAPKAEPEFEFLRARLRRKFLIDDLAGIHRELVEFRLGRPDPEGHGKRLPHTVKPTVVAGASTYRAADGTMVIAYGADGSAKQADAGDVAGSDLAAGFVAALGGRPAPAERRSGGGGLVTATAPRGFAYAYAFDGAPGHSSGGEGGPGGQATAQGGAGQFARSGETGRATSSPGGTPGTGR